MELLTIWILATLSVAILLYAYWQAQDSFFAQQEFRDLIDKLQAQALQERVNLQKERKDLYDRLMAGTLPQYKEHADEQAPEPEIEDPVVEMEDAKEELMNG